jgi:16S rRNA (uracil1498-N3)-methyltransferase
VKQCGRATVPRIAPVQSFDEWFAAGDPGRRVMLVEPGAADARCGSLDALRTSAPASITLVVGPEGGWSGEEVDRAAEAGVLLVSLGGLTLRADAAPTVAIALMRFVLGDL